MFRRFLLSAVIGTLFALPVAAQQSAEDLTDLDGSRLNDVTAVCGVVNLAAKSYIGTRDYVEDKKLLEQAQLRLSTALADVFYTAQLNSGVSMDDVDPVAMNGALIAIMKDYNETRLAEIAAEQALPPEEEWTSFDIARTALSVASVADPTGVAGVAAAYTYPKCGSEEAEKSVGGFCWRDSHTRGAGWIPKDLGRVADCPPGMTNMGLTCQSWGHTTWRGRPADCPAGYTNNGLTCGRGGDTISAPSRLASCPAGFTNMGLTCYRGPASYTKGCTTIFKTFSCRSGYTDMGCHCQRWAESRGGSSMTCPAGYFKGVAQRCYKTCPDGYENTGEFCTKWPSTLGMDAMSCKTGETKGGARCYRSCPAGYTNTGEFCQIWPETKGISAMTCKSGEFKSGARCYDNNACGYTENGSRKFGVMDAGLCYDTCRDSFYGVGPVCWSSCTGKLKTECAAGCASTDVECGLATSDMIMAPLDVVVSAASLYTATSGMMARRASMQAAKSAARETARAIGKEAAQEGAKLVARQGGKALAREAAEKLARKSVNVLDEELFEAFLRYGDDIVDAGADVGKQFDDMIAEIDDLARGLGDDLADLGSDLADDLDEFDRVIAELDDIIKQADDIADGVSPSAVKRMGNGLAQGAKRAAKETGDLADWVVDNSKKLGQSVQRNVFDPVKKAKSYVPNKMRAKSQFYDDFARRSAQLGAKPYVAGPRLVRGCAKAGITIVRDATSQ